MKNNKLDFIQWKGFSLKSIFKISKCIGTKIGNLVDGSFPYVSRSCINNGITRMCGNIDLLNPKNTITIHAEWKQNYCAFFQEFEYVTDGMIAFLSCGKMDKYSGLYITTLLSKMKYNGKGLLKSLNNLWINLPTQEDGLPNWEYMSKEIQRIEKDINNYRLHKNNLPTKKTIKLGTWKEFQIDELFVNKCDRNYKDHTQFKKYSKISKSKGQTPFVSSTGINNGIVDYVDLKPNQKNAITVSTNGACFDCFYHDYAFCASTDVEILYPRFAMTTEIALFICTVLSKYKGKYDFKNKPKNGIVWKSIIKLPVTNDGKLDNLYMEKYIRNEI